MTITRLTLPEYEEKDFINRETEIDAVKTKIISIRKQETKGKVMVFSGGRNHGKTWFMAHLHRIILNEISQVKSFFISLWHTSTLEIKDNECSEYQVELADSFTQEQKNYNITEQLYKIQHRINVCMGAADVEQATNLELSTWLVGHLVEEKETLFVILVDSVFESDWDLLDQLEKNLLDPLSDLPNILFIFSGRGPRYPWISPNLSVHLDDVHELQEFEEEKDALKLLKDQESHLISPGIDLIKISGGYPSNLALLNELSSVDELPERLDKIIEEHLEIIPAEQPNRDKIRGYLEALSVLEEGFRDGELKALLACYRKYHHESDQNDDTREIRTNLQNTHLVSWEQNRYRINESVRCVLEAYLEHSTPDLWIKLHQAASDIYEIWAEKYPQHQDYFKRLACEHQNIISDLPTKGQTS